MSQNRPIRWKNLPATRLEQDPELLKAWDRLNGSRGNLPFLAGDAVVSALRHLGDASERLLVGTTDATIVAMFLVTLSGKFQWQTF